jgi:antitoxin MazE
VEKALKKKLDISALWIYIGYPWRCGMITKVQKWGNSQGVRLSREILSTIEVKIGDSVNLSVREGNLIVTPLRRVRGGHDLRQLVSQIPKDYKAPEVDWGKPQGREIW